ncbi:MAG TPA: YHYH protein, partial [Planctomycetota bacterium]|nr:YHYH protein [Planctomycetota bacterium]
GQSPDPTIQASVGTILADVQEVRFTATDAYVQATGVPSYPVGPFPGDPNVPADQHWQIRVPRSPMVETGPQTVTPLGPIGLFTNGVVMFNAKDANTYLGLGIWHQNAVVVEASSFDSGLGHPASGGLYHHHQRPPRLLAQLGDDGVHHSPLLGFAFDGFPVYGPIGFASPGGAGGVQRMNSSYRLRSIALRHVLPNGTMLPPAQWGPAVSPTYPLGYYVEDYEFVPGLGDLDANNGRFTVTPDYPLGTYAYFATIDASGASAFPYLVGPTYHGVVAMDDIGGHAPIPAGTSLHRPFTLYVTGMLAGRTASVAVGHGPVSGLAAFGVSFTGGGPLLSPFGPVALDLPIAVVGPLGLDAAGGAVMPLAIPASMLGVVTWWQALAIDPMVSLDLSQGVHTRID